MTQREELFDKAIKLGVEFKKNISNDELERLIEDKEMVMSKDAEANAVHKELMPEGKVTKPKRVKKVTDPRKSALKMKRCIITPLDHRKRDYSSEVISVGSKATGFIKKAIRFNEETLEPISIIRALRSKTTPVSAGSTAPTMSGPKLNHPSAYSIQILPDFTEAEIAKHIEDYNKSNNK